MEANMFEVSMLDFIFKHPSVDERRLANVPIRFHEQSRILQKNIAEGDNFLFVEQYIVSYYGVRTDLFKLMLIRNQQLLEELEIGEYSTRYTKRKVLHPATNKFLTVEASSPFYHGVKYKRQQRILQQLQDVPCVPKVVEDYCLNHEKGHIHVTFYDYLQSDYKTLLKASLSSIDQLRIVIFHLLKNVNCIHNRGIAHRAIDSTTVLISQDWLESKTPSTSNFMLLVGWFRADLYDAELNHIVPLAHNLAHKRAPELLLGFSRYDPSKVDMWGVGLAVADVVCSFLPNFIAIQIFSRKIAFGRDNYEKMRSLYKVFGTDAVESLRDKYQTENGPMDQLRRYSQDEAPGIERYATAAIATTDAVDLAAKLLVLDPAKRITAEEALHHPFVKPCWDENFSIQPINNDQNTMA